MLKIFLASITLTTVSIGDLYHQYFFLVIFLLLGFIKHGRSWLYKPLPTLPILYLPIFCIVVWVYGVVLAVMLSVPFAAYSRNFASLLFYLSFYLIYIYRPSVNYLDLLFKKLALVYCLLSFFFIIQSYQSGNFITFDDHGTSAFRLYYSIGLLVLFVPITFIILGHSSGDKYLLFGSKSYWNKGVLVDFCSLILFSLVIFMSGSKGFYLALLIVLLLSFFILIIRALSKFKISYFGMLLIFSIIALLAFNVDLILSTIDLLLGLEFDDSHPRVIQGRELIADFSLWGNGIGASISSGYSRDELGYGFELSYHNLIHKLGILAFFILFTIFYPFIISVKNILEKRNLKASVLSFSLMLYVIPSYGNPFLISPLTVTFNAVAFYLIIQRNHTQRKAA